MKEKTKKILAAAAILLFFAPLISFAQYTPLAPIGDLFTQSSTLCDYLGDVFVVAIGIALVFAVLMIVIAGFEYITVEMISSKQAAKKRLTDAVLGVLLALGAWVLLNTLNPSLTDFSATCKTLQTTVNTGSGVATPAPTGGGTANNATTGQGAVPVSNQPGS